METPAEEVTSWSTPLVVQNGNSKQLIVCGTERVRAPMIWPPVMSFGNAVACPPTSSPLRSQVTESFTLAAAMKNGQ